MRDEINPSGGLIRQIGTRIYHLPIVRNTAWRFGMFLHHSVGGRLDDWATSGGHETCNTANLGQTQIHARPLPNIKNPVLTAEDVTDYGNADGVADPFLWVTPEGDWHMFFEVVNTSAEPTAVIGHAASPDGGSTWEYDRVVLAGEIHFTFPYIFEWEGTHYMVPDPWYKDSALTLIRLYEAQQFPYEWTDVATIITSENDIHDCILFRWQDRWWAIGGDGTDLYAYYSSTLRSDDWTPHDRNPIVPSRPKAARPAGRPFVADDRMIVFYQDCSNQYGDSVHAYEITELSVDNYNDESMSSSPFLQSSGVLLGWNSGKMHHISPQFDGEKWLCAVDGNIGLGRGLFGDNWSIGIYEIPLGAHPNDYDPTRN